MSHRPKSVYGSTCHRCGAVIQSETKEAKCGNCGLELILEWPALLTSVLKPVDSQP
jgi:RNA polymerase subunit RPABC4/transcription elongation factor Spt4